MIFFCDKHHFVFTEIFADRHYSIIFLFYHTVDDESNNANNTGDAAMTLMQQGISWNDAIKLSAARNLT